MNLTILKYSISLFIISIVSLAGIHSCGLGKSPETGANDNGEFGYGKTILVNNKQEVISPDYVPPDSGGSNQKWSCNRHRELMKKRNCYFGKGLRNCVSAGDTSNSY